MVVLPESGCEMIAIFLRLVISASEAFNELAEGGETAENGLAAWEINRTMQRRMMGEGAEVCLGEMAILDILEDYGYS